MNILCELYKTSCTLSIFCKIMCTIGNRSIFVITNRPYTLIHYAAMISAKCGLNLLNYFSKNNVRKSTNDRPTLLRDFSLLMIRVRGVQKGGEAMDPRS